MAPIRRPARPTSARHLVRRHALRILQANDDLKDDDLKAGYEQLKSFLLPGIRAGPHTITIHQDIATKDKNDTSLPAREAKTLEIKQEFTAVAAQFSLPDNAIHSVYPPQGHADEATILPHVVFSDPTFPWEREVSKYENVERKDVLSRLRTPWLAVFSFTEDELRLDDSQLSGSTSFFSKMPSLKDKLAPRGPNLTVSKIPVVELKNSGLSGAAAPFATAVASSEPSTTTTDLVFLKRDLFVGLFTKRDSQGKPFVDQNDDKNDWKAHAHVYQHALHAHRRDINNQGMASATASSEDPTGSYGVVFSGRTGPSSIKAPTVVYVHLVSLEGIDSMASWPPDPTSDPYVALPTLFSWSYVCLPPSSIGIWEEFDHLGTPPNIELLRPFKEAPPTSGPSNPVRDYVASRMTQGYSLSRYRTQTGEQTVCFVRGPAVPVETGSKNFTFPEHWPATSMTGQDLQIMDGNVGIMDITYSAAWQLGRAMALGDSAFTAALFRVRAQILQRATPLAHTLYATQQGVTQFKNKAEMLKSLSQTLNRVESLHDSERLFSGDSALRRWMRTEHAQLDLSYKSQGVQANMDYVKAAKEVGSTPNTKDPTEPDISTPYDEYNTPFSTDWAVVLHWIMERKFLGSIPAHYLLSDSSHLPLESIRFFEVDQTWVNCLVDGALCLGNHTDQEADPVRDGIKEAVNAYLQHNMTGLGFKPPVPRYGCYIRSALVTKFPDLIISTNKLHSDSDNTPFLLRHEIVGEGVMLCLFSQMPSKDTYQILNITQPPHQQNFIAGVELDETQIKTQYRKAYDVSDPQLNDKEEIALPIDDRVWKPDGTSQPQGHGVAYLWDNKGDVAAGATTTELRLLLIENLAADYFTAATTYVMVDGKKAFQDTMAASALLGYQCNNPAWQLVINLPDLPIQSTLTSPLLPYQPREPPPQPDAPTIRSPNRKSGLPSLKQRYKHSSPRAHPPPTRRRGAAPLAESGDPVASGDLPANLPVYAYNYWQTTNPGKPDDPKPVSMNSKLQQDVIFSIVLQTGGATDYGLSWILIDIPVGQPTADRTTLTGVYHGSGASMLSNLRFIPSVKYSEKDNKLQIKLMPRSSTARSVAIAKCTEVSFILYGVDVSDNSGAGDQFKNPDGTVNLPLTILEQYENVELKEVQSPTPIVFKNSPPPKT